MYQPALSPLSGGLALSALVATVPLLTLFLLLGAARVRAHWAGLAALAVAVGIAVAVYGMPLKLAALAASEGAVFGLFPIGWILVTAIWLYQLTVVSGTFEDLRRSLGLISDDPRVLAVVLAFCFGALLEALAGFGAPVAITGIMLIALGFPPFRAAVTVLVANTAPVAFGAMGIPVITAGGLTKIPYTDIGAYVGHQVPLLALLVPLLLTVLVDGFRGLRQIWPVALVCGATFALVQYVSSNYISVELTDIITSLASMVAAVVFMRFWRPRGSEEARAELLGEAGGRGRYDAGGQRTATARGSNGGHGGHGGPTGGPYGHREQHGDHGRGRGHARHGTAAHAPRTGHGAAPVRPPADGRRLASAFAPYIIVISVFSVAQLWTPVKEFLGATDIAVPWPGLDGKLRTVSGGEVDSTVYNLAWLSSPGTLLLLSGVITALVLRIEPQSALRELGATLVKLRTALLTVASVLALAYAMNLSGQTITIGTFVAGSGSALALLSPVLGWFGTAVTGSDTSANALFATLQHTAAKGAGLDPTLLVSGNTSGGVVGKMISPQNLTIAATAVGCAGQESELLRATLKWSLGLLLILSVLIYAQSGILAWTLP
ncbi:L-lactate permease [Streptomyces sp. HNM0575]|uniref:L-lactate permease n=1 Tax=Streptomyces sp. HNM0575 TaxID=2716338 RepID=UPI00145F8241|nr:L-lactate permease [Streptomyces sp. HNM0575]NLU72584.1 L-lactate permease [Streptomyces sp. HNM0575]